MSDRSDLYDCSSLSEISCWWFTFLQILVRTFCSCDHENLNSFSKIDSTSLSLVHESTDQSKTLWRSPTCQGFQHRSESHQQENYAQHVYIWSFSRHPWSSLLRNRIEREWVRGKGEEDRGQISRNRRTLDHRSNAASGEVISSTGREIVDKIFFWNVSYIKNCINHNPIKNESAREFRVWWVQCSRVRRWEMYKDKGHVLERWHRNRMSELDMMQLSHTDALSSKHAHSVSHVFRETYFINTSKKSESRSAASAAWRSLVSHCIRSPVQSTLTRILWRWVSSWLCGNRLCPFYVSKETWLSTTAVTPHTPCALGSVPDVSSARHVDDWITSSQHSHWKSVHPCLTTTPRTTPWPLRWRRSCRCRSRSHFVTSVAAGSRTTLQLVNQMISVWLNLRKLVLVGWYRGCRHDGRWRYVIWGRDRYGSLLHIWFVRRTRDIQYRFRSRLRINRSR